MLQEQRPFLTLVAVGDVSPFRDDPPSIFQYCGDVFKKADIVFGQMENPMSERGCPTVKRARRLPPKNVSGLTEQGAGFDVMSYAANHAMHYGYDAFFDTIELLEKNNIAVVGAGKNIEEARKPAIVERDGTKVGFLAYLSICREDIVVAEQNLPGCVPLRSTHRYEQKDSDPGTPPLIVTELFPEDKQAMEEDIKRLRPHVDVLVVSMHCGVHSARATIAMYQKEAAHAAIDSGADLVLHHHAHILRGIEVYKGGTIFYGLGNFAAEHHLDASRKLNKSAEEQLRKKLLYGIKPIPGYEKFPWRADALNTMIVKAYLQDKKIQKITYVPAYITPNLEPEVVTRKDPRAQGVFDYVAEISETADLEVSFSWQGDEVLVSERK